MRETLPNRRQTETFKFDFNGIKHHASVSYDKNWQVKEVFIDAGKVNTGVQSFARDGAILMSLCLQHGCPLDTLRHAMTRDDIGAPASPLGALLDIVGEMK